MRSNTKKKKKYLKKDNFCRNFIPKILDSYHDFWWKIMGSFSVPSKEHK